MESNKSQKHFTWAVAIVAATVVIVSAFALFAYLKTIGGVKDTMQQAGVIASNFLTENITQTFQESIPQVTSTQGNVLELAVSQSDETFARSTEKKIGWGYIDLGTTYVEIRVPVTFRYHLLLSDTWRLASHDHVCMVLAPQIRPSLPPSIHTASMEKKSESGWARFDKDDQLDELEKSMEDSLQKRAQDPNHLKLVREACRQSVAAFVKRWLMREDYWRSDRFASIVVVFPDETTATSSQELSKFSYKPAIELEKGADESTKH